MSTKSRLLALAFGVALAAPFVAPAAAMPSPHPGGFKVMMPAHTSPIIASKKIGGTSVKLPPTKVTGTKPAPGAGSKIGGNKVAKVAQKKPIGIDNICPFNKFKCPQSPGKGGKGGTGGSKPLPGGMGGGSVVVLSPPGSIDVPSVAVSDPSVAPVTVGQRPVAPHCTADAVPPLAAMIDRLLPTAQLAQADLDQVTTLRAAIADLAAAGDEQKARAVEVQAMKVLGYDKMWLRCGYGTFMWVKRPPVTAATQ